MKFEEGDVVLCKVVRIEEASVFLEVEGEMKGSMFMPEVAAGRIRNLRDYVSPGRVVVCKVLRVYPDHLELSLRRVTAKEREAALERYKREKRLEKILELAGLDGKKIIREIKNQTDFEEFFDEVWSNPELLKKFVPKEKFEQIANSVQQKAEKEKILRRKVKLSCSAEDGVERIRAVLATAQDKTTITYAGSGTFFITAKGESLKELDHLLERTLEELRKTASKRDVSFEIVKGKAN
ncbi:hypothetical protein D6817_03950 [Candidatus Pacearchaeota archaeon]|nr:MAG: hypothetical protein D6817_03950 [Candidatus Pacearchaeota archaeon]